MKILGPEAVAEKMKEFLQGALDMYNDGEEKRKLLLFDLRRKEVSTISEQIILTKKQKAVDNRNLKC